MATSIARWLLNEASSGTAITTIVDDTTNGNSLDDIDYDGTATDAVWTSNAGGNGLSFYGTAGTAASNAYAQLADISTNGNIGSSLASTTSACLLLRLDDIVGTGDAVRVFFIGTDSGNGDFAVTASTTNLGIRWDEDGTGGTVNYTLPTGLNTICINIDTTLSTALRCSVHLNGSATPETSTAGSIPNSQALTSVNGTDRDIVFANRGAFNRASTVDLYYVELFDSPLTDKEIADSHEALVADNDSNWVASQVDYMPLEGIECIEEIVYQNSTTDRGTGDLKIGLFVDTDLDADSAWTDVTEPTTQGGYAEKDLTNASWTISSGTASYAEQSFQASGAAFSSDIQGYYIRTTGTTPRILFFETSTAQTVADGYEYNVTPSINMSDGTPGITVDEGIELMLNMVFKGSDTNRGTDLGLALYTNTGTLTTSTSLATMTEPSTGGYADKTLTDASWTITAGVAEYPIQTWAASGAAYAAAYGTYIYSTGTVDKLLHIDPQSVETVADGESYSIDINIDLTDT